MGQSSDKLEQKTRSSIAAKPEPNIKVNVEKLDIHIPPNGFYYTPRVQAEVNLDRKGTWQVIADADMYQGNAGIRYNF